jgi:hypothetical protein
MADACFLTDRHVKVLNFEIIREGIFNCSSNVYIKYWLQFAERTWE